MDAPRLRIEELDGATLRLAGVEFIDSSGLRVLLSTHEDQELRGARLELVSPSEAVQRLLELTALVGHLHVI